MFNQGKPFPRRIARPLALSVFGVLISMVPGCGADDAVDNAVDCHSICGRYRDCFDDGYDVDGCSARCRDAAGKDRNYQRKVDMCAACIDDRACSEAVFPCTDDCIEVVP